MVRVEANQFELGRPGPSAAEADGDVGCVDSGGALRVGRPSFSIVCLSSRPPRRRGVPWFPAALQASERGGPHACAVRDRVACGPESSRRQLAAFADQGRAVTRGARVPERSAGTRAAPS